MARTKQEPKAKKAKKEEAHDFMPDFLKNLNKLIEIYQGLGFCGLRVHFRGSP